MSCDASCIKSKWNATYWQRLAITVFRKERQDVHPPHQLVTANQAEPPVRVLCETLKVLTSGYYDWRDHPLSQRAKANVSWCERIAQYTPGQR